MIDHGMGPMAALAEAIAEGGRQGSERVGSDLARRASHAVAGYRFGILTALPKEMAAVRAVFGPGTKLPAGVRSTVAFHGVTCPSRDGGEHRIVLAQSLKMGNNSAAVAAALMLAEFPQIEDILIVGIAGGMPNIAAATGREKCDDHVRKGDVVVSDAVLQYDMLKLEEDREENRARAAAPSSRLLSAMSEIELEAFAGRHDWERYIDASGLDASWARPRRDELYSFEFHDDHGFKVLEAKLDHPKQDARRPGAPLVHRGVVGSANILLKNSRVRDKLRLEHKVKAVEMEGSGVSDAAWSFSVGYLVVRGICDYCDRKKDDKWQKHAALVAAAYARAIVEQVPTV